ncbi:hypothetical protein AOC36_08065 [Erysipelothrix larvae]|uniref:Glycosyl hydrolase-like 10 domain-containing protein n=1 Tax=Erysipelothrix larvae TaxID=1514105 RepID=A0A0X8H0Q0_9FIRM|nr:family 10 glycosylhydrolase [Erysipelothrix larvae]AMC93942.1 hypothetical protein AOC36_08065 [Erysipelothrix larvae]
MKKLMALLCGLGIVLSQTGHIKAEDSTDLYRYVKYSDGTYGYDTNVPVMFYSGSNERISIPNVYTQEKEQFKSTWIATIFNLHFKPDSSDKEDIQELYKERIETAKEMNLNALIFQVRPTLDAAFYQSDINPSSEYFTGKQGVEASYDPMYWMIEETHRNGMEFHAWFNPYRVTNSDFAVVTGKNSSDYTPGEKALYLNEIGLLADDNFAVLNPEYVLEFKGKLFLNPGEPEVVQHVVDTVVEFMEKYDTDAIHFDDYFYPYRVGDDYFGKNGEDATTYDKYGEGYTDIDSWRRDNVTFLIDSVKEAIDNHNETNKTAIQFGISPFGIWEHKAIDDRGSNTPTGSSKSYSEQIYADTYQWIKDEKLDYVAPQIYWAFAAAAAPYGEIARWWDSVAEGTNVNIYVGHAAYKHTSNGGWDADWMNPEELNNQVKFNQNYKNIKGSIMYSYNDILVDENTTSPQKEANNKAIEILKSDTFKIASLTPSHQKLSHNDTKPVDSVVLEGSTLKWIDSNNTNARFYVVYAGNETGVEELVANPNNIVDRVYFEGKGDYEYTLSTQDLSKNYAVTVLDRAYVETKPVTLTEDSDFSVTFPVKEITVKYGEKLTEQQFIERLNIESNYDITVTTNFDEVVDHLVSGAYDVKVVVERNNVQNQIARLSNESYETTIKVVVENKDVETPEEPDTEKPGETDKEKPGGTDTEKPGGTDTEKPGGTDTEKPGGTDTEKPGGTDTEKPGGADTEKPGGTDTEKPGEEGSKLPETGLSSGMFLSYALISLVGLALVTYSRKFVKINK